MFHNHEVFAFETTHDVGSQRGTVRDVRLVGPDRVVVPRNEIEITGEIIVIQFAVQSHEIVRHKVIRANTAEIANLISLETDTQPGCESFPVQTCAGIAHSPGLISAIIWECNFSPGCEIQPPEVIAPCTVQLIQCAVFISQPILKLSKTGQTVTFSAPEFIICLPPDNVWCRGKVFGHCAGDSF